MQQVTDQTSPESASSTGPAPAAAPRVGMGGWTILPMALGVGMIAACLLIPQADENRRLVFECQKLERDLAHVNRQIEVNDEFINRVGQDPILAERLAQRQMKLIRKGTTVLEVKGQPPADDRSPFSLVTIEPPADLPQYRPIGGRLATLVQNGRTRIYMIGGGLLLLALGMVFGVSSPSPLGRGQG